MSLEMHVFLKKTSVPDRSSWHDAVGSLSLPLVFDPELNPLMDSGFSPSRIRNIDSGFEIYSEPAQQILESYLPLSDIVADRNWCITFRWGGDVNECACVLAASAGLVKLCDAVAFYPDDDLVYDLNRLLDEVKGCLQ